MARPLRIQYAGAVYHITARGNEKKAIFKEDRDRKSFLDILANVEKRYHWLCHTYCLMGNHYHLLVETPDSNLALGMRQLNGVYTQLFNRRHRRCGHLFQGRYKSILIQKESHLLEVCRYVVLNPVRAGMATRPGEWRWSSYRAVAGKEKAHSCLKREWILSQFGGQRRKAEEMYRRFVDDGMGKESVWQQVKGQALLGEEGFVEKFKETLAKQADKPEIPKSQRFAHRPILQEIFSDVVIRSQDKRNAKIVEAVEKYGYTQRQIADFLGMHFSSVSRILRQRMTIK
jgi:putative transposase